MRRGSALTCGASPTPWRRACPKRTPRPELRERVLASFGTTRGAAAASHARGVVRVSTRWLPLAATLALTLGIGVYAARLQARVADLEARLEQAILQAATAETRDGGCAARER